MIALDRSNFDAVVTEGKGVVLVDFAGPGCGMCRLQEQTFATLAERMGEDCPTIATVDVSADPELAWSFQVMSVPTVAAFVDGVQKELVVGAKPLAFWEELIAKLRA